MFAFSKAFTAKQYEGCFAASNASNSLNAGAAESFPGAFIFIHTTKIGIVNLHSHNPVNRLIKIFSPPDAALKNGRFGSMTRNAPGNLHPC